ncbi:MAG: hypothetical protein DMF84_04585 [Acidobacteria bacterium]|nr:MAG: hypothetical protein DMF84_04585 [Acidobacteriota bacterium]
MSGADFRLTLRASAPFRDLAADVAAKFAESAGSSAGAAASVGKAVERLAARVTSGSAHDADVEFEMERRDTRLIVRASSGNRIEETSCPLAG